MQNKERKKYIYLVCDDKDESVGSKKKDYKDKKAKIHWITWGTTKRSRNFEMDIKRAFHMFRKKRLHGYATQGEKWVI